MIIYLTVWLKKLLQIIVNGAGIESYFVEKGNFIGEPSIKKAGKYLPAFNL